MSQVDEDGFVLVRRRKPSAARRPHSHSHSHSPSHPHSQNGNQTTRRKNKLGPIPRPEMATASASNTVAGARLKKEEGEEAKLAPQQPLERNEEVTSTLAVKNDDHGKEESSPASSLTLPMVWIDCEMTGLDLEKDFIIEIAVVVTNGDLTQLHKGPNLVIHQEKATMDGMNAWCQTHHGASGLTAAVLASSLTMEEAERQVLAFIKRWIPTARTAPLAGNSVHADKAFLVKQMPSLAAHLHYRIIDVSTIKELTYRWLPRKAAKQPKKSMRHRAMDDILESIEELKYYKRSIFGVP